MVLAVASATCWKPRITLRACGEERRGERETEEGQEQDGEELAHVTVIGTDLLRFSKSRLVRGRSAVLAV